MSFRRFAVRLAAALFALAICLGALPAFADEGERSNVDIIFDFLTNDLELNAAAACGVLANIERESAFRCDVYGDGGTSYGICQWHDYTDSEGNPAGGRFTDLRNYCDEHELDWHTIEGQLEYLKYELNTFSWYRTTLEYLRGVPNTDLGAYDAADYWCQHFEIPASKERQGALRGEAAREKYWLIYGDGTFTDDGAIEIWRVIADGVVARAAPSDRAVVTDTLTKGAELRVTEIMTNKNETWLKVPFGWCRSAGFEYVSGELCCVQYKTDCAASIAETPASFGSEVILASAEQLSKYGFAFAGWDVDGDLRQPGESIGASGKVTAAAVWERDPSVALLRGDANSDGKDNARDVTLIMRSLIGADVWIYAVTADSNGDFKLNAKDVTALMKHIVGISFENADITADEEAAWASAAQNAPGEEAAADADEADALDAASLEADVSDGSSLEADAADGASLEADASDGASGKADAATGISVEADLADGDPLEADASDAASDDGDAGALEHTKPGE